MNLKVRLLQVVHLLFINNQYHLGGDMKKSPPFLILNYKGEQNVLSNIIFFKFLIFTKY